MAAIGFAWAFHRGRVEAAAQRNGAAMLQPSTQLVVSIIAVLAGSFFGAMALIPLLRADAEQPSQEDEV